MAMKEVTRHRLLVGNHPNSSWTQMVTAADFDAERQARLEAERQVGELREENSAIRELHCHAFEEASDLKAKLDTAMGLLRDASKKVWLHDVRGRITDFLNTSTEGDS